MLTDLRRDADQIIQESLKAVSPEAAVARALEEFAPGPGRTILLSVGKAAWRMANAAVSRLGAPDKGLVITKYGHSEGSIGGVAVREAAHPVPDEAGFAATREALAMVSGLTADDTVLFLLSGGGSALFEAPLVSPEELQAVTKALLASGADFTEINTVRKRLSGVKGGKFAAACAPARIFCVILSDVLGDRPDVIASGPAVRDLSTAAEALAVAEKYRLPLSRKARELLAEEPPADLPPTQIRVTGSVRELVKASEAACRALGYDSLVLTDSLSCEAKDAGRELGALASFYTRLGRPAAVLAGGETVVKLTGSGLGGRNQELALAAAEGLAGLPAAVFSLGSDGTDGPTDAAGGYTDGDSLRELRLAGFEPVEVLKQNDAYHALKAVGGLLMTGPTGTNVNDVAVLLCRPSDKNKPEETA